MAHLTEAKINAAIRRAGLEHIEFCRGDGYCYFTFDDGKWFDSHSVMVCYISQLPLDSWLEKAREAADVMAANRRRLFPTTETQAMLYATFPPRFITDCFESDCDVGEVEWSTSKSISLRMSPEQEAELESRARHYADDAMDGPGLIGLKLSARACLKALKSAREAANARAEVERRGEAGGVADMEALARLRPLGSARRDFTTADYLTVQYRPRWTPEFEYRHNGVRVERERAVELIGERL